MVGDNQIVIDIEEIAKQGMTTSAESTDGGFSPETDAVNFLATPGVLYAPAAPVDSDTDVRLTGGIIASCPDMNVTSPSNRLVVADNGTLYRYNGTKIAAAAIASDGSTYAVGFTDIVTFQGEAYISAKEKMRRWQNDDTMDAGASWPFTFTSANVPHPMLVFEENLFIADKNLLLRLPLIGDANAPATMLTLGLDQVILALAIDPGSGKMLISTSNALDMSGSIPAIYKILWYDGFSNKPLRSLVVDDMVVSFENMGGVTYVGYGRALGYLTSGGLKFLRKLTNLTTFDSTLLPWKHRITHIDRTLYVLDGRQILAYGEVFRGYPIPYYCYKNQVNTNNPSCIFPAGASDGASPTADKRLGIAFATTKFYSWDTVKAGTTNTMSFYTKKYKFQRPMQLRNISDIEYADAVTNNDNNRSLVQVPPVRGTSALAIQGGTNIKNETGSSVYDIGDIVGFYQDMKVRWTQFRYNTDTTQFGVRRIFLQFDPGE